MTTGRINQVCKASPPDNESLSQETTFSEGTTNPSHFVLVQNSVSLGRWSQKNLLQRRFPLTKHTEPSPIMRAISNTEVSLSQSIGISLRRFSRVRRRVRIYVRTCAMRFVHRGQTFHTMHFHLNVIRSFSGSAELTPSLFMGNHVQSGLLTEVNQVCSHRHRTLWIPT